MGLPVRRGTYTHQDGKFAARFVRSRIAGFEKDIRICLKASKATQGSKITHAYFPALGTCCATLEYLAGLYRGNLKGISAQHISDWAQRFMPQPSYDNETIRILFDGFRHPVAHRGIASGVWVDPRPGPTHGRRLTWKILANAARPSCRVVPEAGQLQRDPPWPCAYTHRVHIHLRGLAGDIRTGAIAYGRAVATDRQLQMHFMRCMEQLYPR